MNVTSKLNKFTKNICLQCFRCNFNRIISLKSSRNSSGNNAEVHAKRVDFSNGPGLKYFLRHGKANVMEQSPVEIPYIEQDELWGSGRKVYFEVYGCQMNVNDTEVVWSILKDVGYVRTDIITEADVILIVTCSIRENAEIKVWNKLSHIKRICRLKNRNVSDVKIGILGCMAERLKQRLVEKEHLVDIVAGPDSYRDLPRLLALTNSNITSVNVMLSFDETYADVVPVRLNQDSVSSFVTIMRGCDNMCTYCIVPFTRGRERSRPIDSILQEISELSDQGVKEVTLLGQNVNSYRDISSINYYGEASTDSKSHLSRGFSTIYNPKKGGLRFADLLHKAATLNPEIRIRFTSPHPKDFPDEVLAVIKDHPNICRSLHIPAQSGNSAVLERMRRGYTREAYIALVQHIRDVLPDVAISSDFICGFCGETDEEFADTISLMEEIKYNTAFTFAYSMRERTKAYHRYKDDVPANIKQQRLEKMIETYRREVLKLNEAQVGQKQLILVEGESKRSSEYLAGRNDGNLKVIFPEQEIPESSTSKNKKPVNPGDYIVVLVSSANSQVLKGIPLYHSSMKNFSNEIKFDSQNNPVF